MYKYLIFFLFLFIPFISNESLSDEASQTPNIKIYESTCANALLNALNTFTLPQALSKVGASNIEIKRYKSKNHVTSLTYETEPISGKDTHLFYMTYNVSFPANGQIKTIYLQVGGFPIEDTEHFQGLFALHDKDDTEVLRRIKNILGSLPERTLSLVNVIHIRQRPHPDSIKEFPNIRSLSGRDTTRGNFIIHFGLPQDHPVYKDGSTTEDIILQYLHDAEMTMLHGIGNIMLLKYKDDIPDHNQKWQDATSADNTNVSKHDINIDEDFIAAMRAYIITNGGLYYPNLTRGYIHRFAVLDEIMGLTPSQRRQIIEINNLFEIQTNDLLQNFNLPTNNFIFVPNDNSELFQKPLEEISSEVKLAKNLRDSWRHNYDNLRVSMILADKISTLQKERALDFNSIESRLVRQILGIIATGSLPRFVIETIHLFDTLSTSEMERRLHILEEANKAFYEEKYNTFEQALEETMRL